MSLLNTCLEFTGNLLKQTIKREWKFHTNIAMIEDSQGGTTSQWRSTGEKRMWQLNQSAGVLGPNYQLSQSDVVELTVISQSKINTFFETC